MKFKIFKYKKVKSTNDIAMSLIKKKNTVGFIRADIQTKGRGQHGKKWISKGGNLFATIFFPLKKNYPKFSEFSLINAIIISNIIKIFCKKKEISFKWPNDIFINKKKICGILQETIVFNNKKFIIIGIGINVTSNPIALSKYKATNILFETNKKYEVSKIAKLIIKSYKSFLSNLKNYDYSKFKKKSEIMAL